MIESGASRTSSLREEGRVFLCDPSLKDFSGHCFAYFEPLRRKLDKWGREVEIIGHRDAATVVKQVGVIPQFQFWTDERNVGQARDLSADDNADRVRAAHEIAIAQDLAAIDDRVNLVSGDVIIINSVKHWPIRGITTWLEQIEEHRRPRILIILHFTSEPEKHKPDFSRRMYVEAFQHLRHSACRSRVHLATDARTLLAEYSALGSPDVALLPLPHTTFPQKVRRRDGKIIVSYVGEARINKGFQLLPFVARKMLQSELSKTVEFHIHSFCYNREQSFYKQALAELSELPNVVLHPMQMDETQYLDFLQASDLILIAYQQEHYHKQTSGIFAEAIGMGIPVIVSRGTWMARELADLQGGGQFVFPDDYIDLFSSIRSVCLDYGRHKSESEAARSRWLEFHNIDRFTDIVDGIFDGCLSRRLQRTA